MKKLNRTDFAVDYHPTKIIQFGTGNFLRGFIDWQINYLNKHHGLGAGISVVKSLVREGASSLNEQDGLFTTIIRGIDERGNAVENIELIECVNQEISAVAHFDEYLALAEQKSIKVIFSNTTEAGIVFDETNQLDDTPAASFPGKLTQWLYKRFQHFNGSNDYGVVIVPCELIDRNGEVLKETVMRYCELWQLEPSFISWLNEANSFCSTLVDRIVTGYPKDEADTIQEKLGYHDDFMVAAEYYNLFVIQGPQSIKSILCPDNSKLNIKVVDDITPYKKRKVAILNGAHTAMVPLAYMMGLNSVGEAMSDELIYRFVDEFITDEVIPTLGQSKDELAHYANDVIARFKNPYIHHLLLSISLNSMAKFSTRIIPQLLKFQELTGKTPKLIAHALAAQILMYKGKRGDEDIPLQDEQKWLTLFSESWSGYDAGDKTTTEVVIDVLSASWHWQVDLSKNQQLVETVDTALKNMLSDGVGMTLTTALNR